METNRCVKRASVCELSEQYLTVDLCLRTLQDNLSGPTALGPSQNHLSHFEWENSAKQESKPAISSQVCFFYLIFPAKWRKFCNRHKLPPSWHESRDFLWNTVDDDGRKSKMNRAFIKARTPHRHVRWLEIAEGFFLALRHKAQSRAVGVALRQRLNCMGISASTHNRWEVSSRRTISHWNICSSATEDLRKTI